jgi:4-coumarate--CoA ligase (photoactive yellow protein activation family)
MSDAVAMAAGPARMGTATPPAGAAWHADRGALARVLRDLVCAEVAAQRPGAAPLPLDGWDETLALDESGLGLDSLERLSVASAVSEALHLHESGLEDLLLARRRFGQWLDVAQAALRRFDDNITFRTSGSSGTPKPCMHLLAQLRQEVNHSAARLAGVRRVVSAVPSHHIYGFLFTVLLPQALGIDEVIDARQATPQALARGLRDGDLLVSHPAHWALLARHVAALPAGVTGVTSTAPCPDELAEALRAQGLQRLLQVYGSSETAGVGWREHAGAPFELMPMWRRDGDGALRREGTAHFVALQDRLHWHDERHFEVRGRIDAVVQVGGVNVSLTQVRDVLLAHPAVADAAVRPMRADEGSRLKAYVVPRDGTHVAAIGDALAQWVQERLPAPARPKVFTVGAALPVDARGKACDWPLAAAG